MPIEKGSAVYHQAVSREGAGDLREGPRQRGQAVWGGERAHRTAMDALSTRSRRSATAGSPSRGRGPPNTRAKESGLAASRGQGEEPRGLDYDGHSKEQLYERARSSTPRRSKMSKEELAEAITRRHRAPGPIAHAASRRGRVVRRICCRRRLLGLSRDRATSPSELSPLSDLPPAERAGWGTAPTRPRAEDLEPKIQSILSIGVVRPLRTAPPNAGLAAGASAVP